MINLYIKTEESSQNIKRNNYNVVEIWKHEFDQKIAKKAELKLIKKSYNFEINTKLIARDAFFGGRTNASKLYYKCKPSQVLKYIDFVSLYPTVMFYDNYPVGHPMVISKPDFDPNCQFLPWYGIIKCKILPPKTLYHPVLPVKIVTKQAEKLFFPLCYACAKVQHQNKCSHSDEERCLIGTWCTNEVNKAIEKGYKIVQVYEAHHFSDKSTDLFKSYIKKFMQIKQEASGLPEGKTKEQYIQENFDQLQISLDPNKIELNKGRRAVAKLCLNSLWGKFGQRQNKPQNIFVNEIKDFYDIVTNEKLDNVHFREITEEIMELKYQFKDVFVPNSYDTNEYVAAFTTANARLRLYDLLDKLKEDVLYYDTDSVIYIDNGENTIPTGSLLGELTLEDEIFEFVSTGPKSYSYKTVDGKFLTKVKGFTLNFTNSQVINHDSMKKLVWNEIDQLKITNARMITRNAKTKTIENKLQEKVIKFAYDKRVINCIDKEWHIDTLPYGYIDNAK